MSAMTPLLTVAQLAIWARTSIEDDDEFALAVVDAASLVVADRAKHMDWIEIIAPATARVAAPSRAVLIAIQLAKRTFLNPDAVIAEGGIGPIGGDRFVEDFARTLELTSVEGEELDGMRPAVAGGNGALWVMTIETGRTPANSGTIYVPDGSSADWPFPIGTEGVDDWAYSAPGIA